MIVYIMSIIKKGNSIYLTYSRDQIKLTARNFRWLRYDEIRSAKKQKNIIPLN